MPMRPLGWITVGLLVIGAILYIYFQFFTEMTVQRKVWFIWGVTAWGVMCVFFITWSFLDYYK